MKALKAFRAHNGHSLSPIQTWKFWTKRTGVGTSRLHFRTATLLLFSPPFHVTPTLSPRWELFSSGPQTAASCPCLEHSCNRRKCWPVGCGRVRPPSPTSLQASVLASAPPGRPVGLSGGFSPVSQTTFTFLSPGLPLGEPGCSICHGSALAPCSLGAPPSLSLSCSHGAHCLLSWGPLLRNR